jgi:putative transposase
MRHHNIQAVLGYKSPKAVKGRPSILAPNRVNREFTVEAPECVWVPPPDHI